MSNACTIYSLHVNYGSVAEILSKTLKHCDIRIVGSKEKWEKIVAEHQEWTFSLTNMRRVEPGDKFSKLILGTLNFFYKINTDATHNKERIIKLVESSVWVIGIMVEPEFKEEAGHFECIFKIAELLDGLIFNGIGMIDKNGLMILDKDGEYDKSNGPPSRLSTPG